MYLSLLKLNIALRKTREMLMNPYTLHQAVYRAFPDESNGGLGRVLYRVDQSRCSEAVSLLVQSEKPPDWTKADFLRECLLEKEMCKQLDLNVKNGQYLHFLLRANPCVKKQAEGKRNGYRMGLLREEDQVKWFHKKADESGFTVVNCEAIPEGIIHDERGHADQGKLRHYAVRFKGTLKVVNPETFTATLNSGIGPAKGFGFGLLSIAPVRG